MRGAVWLVALLVSLGAWSLVVWLMGPFAAFVAGLVLSAAGSTR